MPFVTLLKCSRCGEEAYSIEVRGLYRFQYEWDDHAEGYVAEDYEELSLLEVKCPNCGEILHREESL